MSKKSSPTMPLKSLLTLVVAGTILGSALVSYAVANVTYDSKADTHQDEHGQMNEKLLVHLSSGIDEPHSLMMGLQKAMTAQDAGNEVFVFMDVHATQLALKSTNLQFADFAPSQDLIASLIDKGVNIYVCPHCLMVNGGKIEDVQAGIQPLSMDALMNFMNGGVTALDY
jgi:predicted peroxiredoxin